VYLTLSVAHEALKFGMKRFELRMLA